MCSNTYIYYEYDDPTNMAIDEAVLQARTENLVPNTLRFFMWNTSTATIGRNQSLSTEIDLVAANDLKIDVVRREIPIFFSILTSMYYVSY